MSKPEIDATDAGAGGYAAPPPPYSEDPQDNSSPFQDINLSARGLEICSKECIDVSVLRMLTIEDMKELSFPFGDRKKIETWQVDQSKSAPSGQNPSPMNSAERVGVSAPAEDAGTPALNPKHQPSAPEEGSETQAWQVDQSKSAPSGHNTPPMTSAERKAKQREKREIEFVNAIERARRVQAEREQQRERYKSQERRRRAEREEKIKQIKSRAHRR